MFKYGSFKLFILKFILGSIFVGFAIFLGLSLITYSVTDPGIGKLLNNSTPANFFGYFGAVSASVAVIVFGGASFIFVIFLFYMGFCY